MAQSRADAVALRQGVLNGLRAREARQRASRRTRRPVSLPCRRRKPPPSPASGSTHIATCDGATWRGTTSRRRVLRPPEKRQATARPPTAPPRAAAAPPRPPAPHGTSTRPAIRPRSHPDSACAARRMQACDRASAAAAAAALSEAAGGSTGASQRQPHQRRSPAGAAHPAPAPLTSESLCVTPQRQCRRATGRRQPPPAPSLSGLHAAADAPMSATCLCSGVLPTALRHAPSQLLRLRLRRQPSSRCSGKRDGRAGGHCQLLCGWRRARCTQLTMRRGCRRRRPERRKRVIDARECYDRAPDQPAGVHAAASTSLHRPALPLVPLPSTAQRCRRCACRRSRLADGARSLLPGRLLRPVAELRRCGSNLMVPPPRLRSSSRSRKGTAACRLSLGRFAAHPRSRPSRPSRDQTWRAAVMGGSVGRAR